VSLFIDSKLTPMIIVASLLLGVFATLLLPREEEPQIKVPMVDVLVSMPGASASEVAERVSRPMEKLLWEIDGVEYVYSTSSPGQSLVVVRFLVGSNVEEALVRLNQKLQQNFDVIPPGVSFPLIKARSIDDVPILALTLHSKTQDAVALRRLTAEVADRIKSVPNVAETTLIGGERRRVQVDVDPSLLAARGLTLAGIVPVIQQANREARAGSITQNGEEILIETGGFLRSVQDVKKIVIGAQNHRPVYLEDVAEIHDGVGDRMTYVLHTDVKHGGSPEEAVTLTVAKRPGTNAVVVADAVLAQVEKLKGLVIPEDVSVTVTRHYGNTAEEKSNELLFHMGIAVFSVSVLILLILGWRESLVVAVAIPSTLGLTLLIFYLYGFTLNRITLFALIFSIGILVDDAIVVVENMVRHFRLPENENRPRIPVAIEAVVEVGNPTILATWAVIAAILPMAFVGGLMGPYMRPIPVGASAAMIFSLLIAFIVTPWAGVRLLRPKSHGDGEVKPDVMSRVYRWVMDRLLHHTLVRWGFLVVTILLLLASFACVGSGWVKVKMLPFDNKSEFQVVLNMPEGSSLEETANVARDLAAALATEPEVVDTQIYAGTSGPYNFNGLVRHYFLRSGSRYADIQVNLLPKEEREAKSHEVARRVRDRLTAIARAHGASVAVAEVPPGPPVLQTLVAEVYGPTQESREALAREVRRIFESTDSVVDIDWYLEAPQKRVRFRVDKEKAALNGITAATIARTLEIALGGMPVDLIHLNDEKEPVQVVLQLPQSSRTSPEDLLALSVRSGDANALPEPTTGTKLRTPPLVPLRELVHLEEEEIDRAIYHKNLLPVIYVVGDVAGSQESSVYPILEMNKKLEALDARKFGGATASLPIYNLKLPDSADVPSMKWDGEWHITLEVFRDLGVSFAVVLVIIYILMVGWFKSYLTPLIVMAAIPFSLVGILPAHGAMHAFFSATSMIGFMAGAGIVIRNSIILVDFIELRLKEGMPLDQAVIDAGAVRFRPMLLTAMAVVVGAAVILTDPIFQGLAIALMAGEIASLLLSFITVPVLYFMAYKKRVWHEKRG
jgi:multidrug efflux pump subunit AcrB